MSWHWDRAGRVLEEDRTELPLRRASMRQACSLSVHKSDCPRGEQATGGLSRKHPKPLSPADEQLRVAYIQTNRLHQIVDALGILMDGIPIVDKEARAFRAEHLNTRDSTNGR